MSTLVLLRHGESAWNAEGLFTGWVDVGLSDTGAREAVAGGVLLREHGLRPDIVHTSVLTRAIQTANLALEEAGLLWLPVARSWRLNEPSELWKTANRRPLSIAPPKVGAMASKGRPPTGRGINYARTDSTKPWRRCLKWQPSLCRAAKPVISAAKPVPTSRLWKPVSGRL